MGLYCINIWWISEFLNFTHFTFNKNLSFYLNLFPPCITKKYLILDLKMVRLIFANISPWFGLQWLYSSSPSGWCWWPTWPSTSSSQTSRFVSANSRKPLPSLNFNIIFFLEASFYPYSIFSSCFLLFVLLIG